MDPVEIVLADGNRIYVDGIEDVEHLAGADDHKGVPINILTPIRSLARALDETVRDLAPDEITIEAAAKISGKVGLVFTTAEAESAFKITFKWVRTHKATPTK